MNIEMDLLTLNEYSRPGKKLKKIKGIVIHWVANPNTSAKQNRDFFEKRKDGNNDFGSSHYIIGLEGEILQAIPENEMAYHVGANEYTLIAKKELSAYPNDCTIGIENCHPNWIGKFNSKTYQSLISLVVRLCKKHNLNENNVYRHFDITGKFCPAYYVSEINEWAILKNEIKEGLANEKD